LPSFENPIKGQLSTTNLTTMTNGHWYSLPTLDVVSRLKTDLDKGLTTRILYDILFMPASLHCLIFTSIT